jgi:hypothetical protein
MGSYLEMNRNNWEHMRQTDSTVAEIAASLLSSAEVEIGDVVRENDRRMVHYSIDAVMGMKKNKIATVKKEGSAWKVEKITDAH